MLPTPFHKEPIFLILILFISSYSWGQTDFSVPISFSIDETNLNRAIFDRFSKEDIPKTNTDNSFGSPVTFSYLFRPVVALSDKMFLELRVSVVYQNFMPPYNQKVDSIYIQTPLLLNPVETTVDPNNPQKTHFKYSIKIDTTGLGATIKSLNLPPQLHPKINEFVGKLSGKEKTIYDYEVSDDIYKRPNDFIDIKLKEQPTFSSSVNGSLNITTVFIYSAKRPSYVITLSTGLYSGSDNYYLKVKIKSNVQFTLNSIALGIETRYLNPYLPFNKTAIKKSENVFETDLISFTTNGESPFLNGEMQIAYINFNVTKGTRTYVLELKKPNANWPYGALEYLKNLNNFTGTLYEQ